MILDHLIGSYLNRYIKEWKVKKKRGEL
jgi:hypothetical protein